MELIRSNRTEILADALAAKVRKQPLPPFEKETIVVQSQGIASWLTLELARRLGIWGNPSFPFPRKAIEQVLSAFDAYPDSCARAYDRERLKWTIARLLTDSMPPDLEPYLQSGADPDRLLRFAGSVARVFDDYVVYRPDLLRTWRSGGRGGWQAQLWRRVTKTLGPHDLSSRMERALPELHAQGLAARIPFRRLHLFSLETLPSPFVRFFGELSTTIPTTLYVLEPSRQFQGDVDETRLTLQLSLPMEGTTRDGHPLLIGAGRLSRDFQQLLIDASDTMERELDVFEEPGRASLLHSVQTDILDFAPEPSRQDRRLIPRSDDSVSIHACTGPMREVQVLHDLLRGALEKDPSLRPDDIVVMAPDLHSYAPLFRAVFGEETEHRIPFEVHDRRSREDTSFYDDLALVLEILDSRFSVLDLVRLMDAKGMRADFRFTSEERARLTDLLAAAGVRWGIDEEHRAWHGFPSEKLHTWRAGLGRLFLGFALEPESTEVFGELLPRGAPTLEDAALFARLSRLCEVLFEHEQRTRTPLTLEQWADELGTLCTQLFSEDDDTSRATHVLRSALEELRDSAVKSSFEERISLKTVRRELSRHLIENTPAVGFLRRGITLTELVPLRSVPFRLVCLLGMSEDAFPRPDDRPSFDLTRGEHRPGDRNRRSDDRHSFLQALLCARDRLMITYSAPSRRFTANPSPLVWELSETINRYYRARGDDAALMTPTVHPLHAFDRRYFEGGALPQSFSRRYLEIAKAIERPSVDRPRVELVAQAAEEEANVISVTELTAWLWSPTRAFVNQVLRARFDETTLYEPSGALTEIGPLEAASVGNGALSAELTGERLSAYLRAAPEFPEGTPGAIERRRLQHEIDAVAARASALRGGQAPSSSFVRVDVANAVVEGRLQGLFDHARIVRRFTRVGRKAELEAWVEHLLMVSAGDRQLPSETRLVLRGTDAHAPVVSYGQVDSPLDELARLVELYRVSLQRPLPLFERASRDYAKIATEHGVKKALAKARESLRKQRTWHRHLDFVFGTFDPFEDRAWSDAFAEAAEAVYGPLFAHRGET
jgi:exodeoxyribonuclease V gamma subunit